MQAAVTNYYAVFGLDRDCTDAQIRSAYRLLAKQHHPDLNPASPKAVRHTQELNAAYEILSDPERRLAYDRELEAAIETMRRLRPAKLQRNLSQDVNLRIEEFLRGCTREVRINDPANPQGPEVYQLTIPPGTAPGTRFRLARTATSGGSVQLRVRALPGFRFKVRGSDLRCNLTIKPERAAQGGMELIPGANGAMLRLTIPRGVGRNEIIRIAGEGLPKQGGGRGDLLVRITYRVAVRVTRPAGR